MTSKGSWKKYKVTLTRLVEEECCIYVTAAGEVEAMAKAMDEAAEVAATVWRSTDSEPHSVSVDRVEDGSTPKEYKE